MNAPDPSPAEYVATRCAVIDLEHDYWFDVDVHLGRGAHRMYVETGRFVISGREMLGPAAVESFYRWRRERGERTARHVVSNLRVELQSPKQARLVGIMCLYAADGLPVLPTAAPILVADIVSEVTLCDDGQWRFVNHELIPIFEGGVPITVPPSS